MDTLPSTGTCLHFLIPPTDIHKCTRSVNAGWNDVASHTRTYKGKKVNDYLCTDRKVILKCLREHQMELCPPVAINCAHQVAHTLKHEGRGEQVLRGEEIMRWADGKE